MGVEAVKSILGDAYGEGYLAACLAALDLNPERVVEALLNDNPPEPSPIYHRSWPRSPPYAEIIGGRATSIQ